MPVVLFCTPIALDDALGTTLLWRTEVERHVVRSVDDALKVAAEVLPSLVLVDAAMPDAERLVVSLRAGSAARGASIVIMARGEFDPAEVRFIESGANAIVRFPPGHDWDDRLSMLISVPPRRNSRLAVMLQLEAQSGDSVLSVAGTVLNLSERGMLVETDVALPLGADIDFKIHLHDVPQPLVGCGQVVRQHSPHRSGVRFYGLEADGPARVRRFVKD